MSPGAWRLLRGLAGAAVVIGAVTVLARITGFARSLVFAHTVGTNCLATAYFTANQIPNIVFEVVAGGALASTVVPLLAGPAARAAADPRSAAEVQHIVGALLTWTVLVLTPLSVLLALVAGPVMSVLAREVPECDVGQVVAVGTRMLVVFTPQLVLYGLAVVLYGVLQSHQRFVGPALAPLVSSAVVISAYLAFVPAAAGWGTDLARLPRNGELVLSIGTTLGVLALVLTVLAPTARLNLSLRPRLRFPRGVAVRARQLAFAGLATLAAQQGAMLVVIVLANAAGGAGALAVYLYAWSVYQLPYAVLAVPIATSAFPTLSARFSHGEQADFDRTAAVTTRSLVLVSCAAAGLLAAVADPVARLFLLVQGGSVAPVEMERALLAFAPGLIGYGLVAHVARVLYACGRGPVAGAATVACWLAVGGAQTAFALSAPRPWVVAALALGSTVGMSVGAALLFGALLRARGMAAVRGVARALVAGVLGAVAALAAGGGLVAIIGPRDAISSVWVTVAAAVMAATAFVLVALVVDGSDMRAAMRRLRGGGDRDG